MHEFLELYKYEHIFSINTIPCISNAYGTYIYDIVDAIKIFYVIFKSLSTEWCNQWNKGAYQKVFILQLQVTNIGKLVLCTAMACICYACLSIRYSMPLLTFVCLIHWCSFKNSRCS